MSECWSTEAWAEVSDDEEVDFGRFDNFGSAPAGSDSNECGDSEGKDDSLDKDEDDEDMDDSRSECDEGSEQVSEVSLRFLLSSEMVENKSNKGR
jgi:cobalamin biosynthesis protein CobT